MSKDLTTSGPSRRSIAKGAAWAVPAVSVAAAAPALAASPLPACTTGATVVANCPGLIDTDTLYFTISNPAGSECVIPQGTAITVDYGGLAGVTLTGLQNIAANVDVLFTSTTQAVTQVDIAPGEAVDFYIFPSSIVSLDLLGTATVSVLGASAVADYIIVGALGLQVALCR